MIEIGATTLQGVWFLGPDYTMIRMYGTTYSPFRSLQLLSPWIFVIQYVMQLVEINNIHLLILRKKERITLLIVMGGYVINERKGVKEAFQVLN